MKNPKIFVGIAVLLLILFALFMFFLNKDEGSLEDSNYQEIGHEMILPFDYERDMNPNVEEYPGKVQIKNVTVKENMHGMGSPIIVVAYENKSESNKLTVEYEGENARQIRVGNSVTVKGEFHFAYKTYSSQLTETLWIVDFIADEIIIN